MTKKRQEDLEFMLIYARQLLLVAVCGPAERLEADYQQRCKSLARDISRKVIQARKKRAV